ncbi:hypothetical protein EXIGLDRAFT_772092 [Exidia glandulosa HHB12029]|uniref:Uncharacterized protein n=1 Tax=Exidia glandulosa HHB12029 TaxID=1314781 RepID=A0A165FJ61_EXIGL|nr:hypothetical protein EXIGLDRAFT_772092 [Exidia glandulosa HHB12029]
MPERQISHCVYCEDQFKHQYGMCPTLARVPRDPCAPGAAHALTNTTTNPEPSSTSASAPAIAALTEAELEFLGASSNLTPVTIDAMYNRMCAAYAAAADAQADAAEKALLARRQIQHAASQARLLYLALILSQAQGPA